MKGERCGRMNEAKERQGQHFDFARWLLFLLFLMSDDCRPLDHGKESEQWPTARYPPTCPGSVWMIVCDVKMSLFGCCVFCRRYCPFFGFTLGPSAQNTENATATRYHPLTTRHAVDRSPEGRSARHGSTQAKDGTTDRTSQPSKNPATRSRLFVQHSRSFRCSLIV